MAKEDKLPPAGKGSRRGPEMMDEDPSIMGKLSQLADREAGGGMAGMGGGGEEQSAQLVVQGAQALMQAAQMNPRLQPIVMQAVSVLQQGVQGLAGGGGEMGMEEEYGGGGGGAPTRSKQRKRPPKQEPEPTEEESFYG